MRIYCKVNSQIYRIINTIFGGYKVYDYISNQIVNLYRNDEQVIKLPSSSFIMFREISEDKHALIKDIIAKYDMLIYKVKVNEDEDEHQETDFANIFLHEVFIDNDRIVEILLSEDIELVTYEQLLNT